MSNYRGYDTLMYEARQKVQNEFGAGENNCVSLDLLIKKLIDKIALETKKLNPNKEYITALIEFKSSMQNQFDINRCADKIEKSRQIESALLLTKGAIESEESVLTKSNVEQKIYIGAGALILLVGLYIIVKK
jgi:hypothetical protein